MVVQHRRGREWDRVDLLVLAEKGAGGRASAPRARKQFSVLSSRWGRAQPTTENRERERSERVRVLDVSNLPRGTADSRALLWWGNLGMMVIEGTMFMMLI